MVTQSVKQRTVQSWLWKYCKWCQNDRTRRPHFIKQA